MITKWGQKHSMRSQTSITAFAFRRLMILMLKLAKISFCLSQSFKFQDNLLVSLVEGCQAHAIGLQRFLVCILDASWSKPKRTLSTKISTFENYTAES
jgi:hypothetical protein